MRDHVLKFESGEYIHTYEKFTPFYIGNFYGSDITLGGEKEFIHCCGFFSGIGDAEWWNKKELDKLTEEQHVRLKQILRRNKLLDNFFDTHIQTMTYIFQVENCLIHRLPNKEKFTLCFIYTKLKEYKLLFDYIIDNKIEALDLLPDNKQFLQRLNAYHEKKNYDKQLDYFKIDYLEEINYDELFEELR